MFQAEGRFPRHVEDVPVAAVEAVARQVKVPAVEWQHYEWGGRAIAYHRAQIRSSLGFREATLEDAEALSRWLESQVFAHDRRTDRLTMAARERCRTLRIEPPSRDRLKRLVRSAIRRHDAAFGAALLARLPAEAVARLDALLHASAGEQAEDAGRAPLLMLRAGSGRAGPQSVADEVAKLTTLRAVGLPADLVEGVPAKVLRAHRRRVAAEELRELRRHPTAMRATLLAAFCHVRAREITDTLVDLLIATVHRIAAKAEQRVESELIADLKRVSGKPALLFKLAAASLARPDGTVRDVIFPVAGEATLHDLVAEGETTAPIYRRHLQTVIRNSYSSHYRRMLPLLLGTLEFRSNNTLHRPVIDALELVRRHATSCARLYPVDEPAPLDGVVAGAWRDAVLETDGQGRQRVNRITYEICVLEALRERLRCREIWVVGADRYRNPDQDLPADFEVNRDAHYAALGLPRDGETFIARVCADMVEALETLDRGLAENPHLRILKRGGGRIALAPLEKQEEPEGLIALKTEIGQRWPMTNLLDMLKEADLRIGFTDAFHTVTDHENLSRAVLQERLLLCLHGLGTNTGLKRMAAGQAAITYKDLLYVCRRFIIREHLREAVARVVNATLRVRRPLIWGHGTTACAAGGF